MTRWLIVAGAAAPLVGLALWLLWPTDVVRLVNESTGRQLACAPARPGAELRLTYVHSIYHQPGSEEFVVRRDAIDLVRLRSPSIPVLEYYARPEPIRAAGAGGAGGAEHAIELAGERHTSVPVLVSALGQRTVHYDGHRWPLHELAADGERVRLSVERAPRMCTLWPNAR